MTTTSTPQVDEQPAIVRGRAVNRLPRKVKRQATLDTQRRCWELRLSGMTYEQVGRALGISESAVSKHCAHTMQKYAAEIGAASGTWREQECARIDSVVQRLWTQRGDPRVADSIMRAVELRTKILGIQAPTVQRVEHSGPGGRPIAVASVAFDASRLTSDQLRTLDSLLAIAMPVPKGDEDARTLEPTSERTDPVDAPALPAPGPRAA